MVCLVSHSKPLLAVIFDQLNERYIAAEEGGGAWLHYLQDISAEKLKVMEPVRLDRMSGYLSLGGFRDRATRDEMRHLAADIFKSYDNLGCSGHEYFRLVTDEKHFNINYRTYPWDHLPGCLIHSEAGGYQASFDGRRYLPTELTKGLIAVPNKLVWEEIRKHFLQSYLT